MKNKLTGIIFDKYYKLSVALILIVCLAACVQLPDTSSSVSMSSIDSGTTTTQDTSDVSSNDTIHGNNRAEIVPVIPDDLPVYVEGSIRLLGNTSPFNGEPVIENRTYRQLFYRLPGEFFEDLFNLLRNDYDLSTGALREKARADYVANYSAFEDAYPQYDPDADEMVLVSAIKWFNITREEMEQLMKITDDYYHNSERLEKWLDSEACELPNLDILYTLDNDIINEYYRYG